MDEGCSYVFLKHSLWKRGTRLFSRTLPTSYSHWRSTHPDVRNKYKKLWFVHLAFSHSRECEIGSQRITRQDTRKPSGSLNPTPSSGPRSQAPQIQNRADQAATVPVQTLAYNHRQQPSCPNHPLHEMAPVALFFNVHTDDWGNHRTGVSSLATAVGGFLTDMWGSHRGGSTSAAAAAAATGKGIVTRSIEHGQGVYLWVEKSLMAGKS